VEALTETTENTWQLNTVDDPLSRVIEKALRFPQTITVKGKERAVVIPVDVYQKLVPSKENLADFLRGSLEDDDELTRDTSIPERAVPFELPC
jgi:prevent-host-death family protein